MGVFFFFKQRTAYESSECDWCSDVCSSDLRERESEREREREREREKNDKEFILLMALIDCFSSCVTVK